MTVPGKGLLRRIINDAAAKARRDMQEEDRYYCMDCGAGVAGALAVKIWEPGTGRDRRLMGLVCSKCAKQRIIVVGKGAV